jgi:hypothetical protein
VNGLSPCSGNFRIDHSGIVRINGDTLVSNTTLIIQFGHLNNVTRRIVKALFEFHGRYQFIIRRNDWIHGINVVLFSTTLLIKPDSRNSAQVGREAMAMAPTRSTKGTWMVWRTSRDVYLPVLYGGSEGLNTGI